ncbi:MAG: peptidylprolyl isomerase [Ignavibacteriales bacterium]|nr:MAG: peptidylprolyl isomerase [Ignavibacteriales bacterium]
MQNAFSTSTAEIETSEGKITVKLNSGIAPFSAGNFIKLAKDGFFKGVNFHRVVPGFVIQAGDRTGTGWGGPGYEIISEYSWAPYIPGTMGMASAGKDTEGSQWFITQWYYPHLQGRYTVFGSVIEGFDTVTRIPQGTYIRTITVR